MSCCIVPIAPRHSNEMYFSQTPHEHMSKVHTYVYSVEEENRTIVEPEILGSKILEQGLEHLMQEACFLSAQPTRETYIYAR